LARQNDDYRALADGIQYRQEPDLKETDISQLSRILQCESSP
jgi:hypothetical protein